MVWLAFTTEQKMELYIWDGAVTALGIIDALNYSIYPFFQAMSDQSYSFCHDNAPVHTARVTQQWFIDNKITILKIPPYSPDLNPAEHAIATLCRLVYADGRQFHAIADLKQALKDAWLKVPQEALANAINSMPARLADIITNHGGPTNY